MSNLKEASRSSHSRLSLTHSGLFACGYGLDNVLSNILLLYKNNISCTDRLLAKTSLCHQESWALIFCCLYIFFTQKLTVAININAIAFNELPRTMVSFQQNIFFYFFYEEKRSHISWMAK